METTAKAVETTERPILQQSRLLPNTRDRNKAILHRRAVGMHLLPMEKLEEFDLFPLTHRLGIIHSIPETHFDVSSATITDVSHLGLFPKVLIHLLQSFANEIKKSKPQNAPAIADHIANLMTAVIYRTITIQKVIQLLLCKWKQSLESNPEDTTSPSSLDDTNPPPNTQQKHEDISQPPQRTSTPPSNDTVLSHLTQTSKLQRHSVCHASICRLLKAQGILRRPMLCCPNKSTCAGCHNEYMRHRRTAQIEKDILHNISDNTTLEPMLQHLDTPTDLQSLRHSLRHLPTFQNSKGRDDHIYGATRYIANTLGLKLDKTNKSEKIDEPPSELDKRQLWRMAHFRCRCQKETSIMQRYGVRTFCQRCSCPVYQTQISHTSSCPICESNDAWKNMGSPCLACQFASIVYRNPFHARLERTLALWLTQEDSSDDADSIIIKRMAPPTRTQPHSCVPSRDHDLLKKRNQIFQQSYL